MADGDAMGMRKIVVMKPRYLSRVQHSQPMSARPCLSCCAKANIVARAGGVVVLRRSVLAAAMVEMAVLKLATASGEIDERDGRGKSGRRIRALSAAGGIKELLMLCRDC